LGLDELIDRLERDADARVASIEARAKSDAEAILAVADQASARAAEDALARRHEQRRGTLDRQIAEAKHRARGDRLRAEHALLERVMKRAGALLEEATQSETYASALPERVTEALRFVEGRAVRVRCLPSLAPAMRRAIAGRDDVTLEEVPGMPAGFSILAHDGSVGVDETLAARLERLRARLFIELLAEVDR
jgi:vacuolar-type H+-ATPase subunit E/Vma4